MAKNPTSQTDNERLANAQPGSIWSFLSFGNILLFGLLAAGIYFFGFSDKGKDMLGDLFDTLSPEWQDTLLGWGEKLGIVPEYSKELADFARSNGVKLGDVVSGKTEVLMQPDLMYKAMLEIPDAVLKLAKKNAKDTPDEKTTALAMAAVRSIVSDPVKLATLLDSKNKANTYALLETLSPIPVKAGALGAFIDKVGLKDGKPTAELSSLLLAVLDEKADAKSRTDALKKFAQRDPAALAALLEGIDSTAITDETLRTQIDAAKSVPKESLGAGLALEEELAKRGTSVGAVMHIADTPAGMVSLLLNSEKRNTVFKGNADRIGRTIGGYEKEAEAELAATKDPAKREAVEAKVNLLRFLNTSEKDAKGVSRAINVQAIYELFEAIDGSAFNRTNPKRTEDVMMGMIGMVTGDEKQTKRLTADNMSAFFADPKNAAAFGTFFETINPGRLPNGKGENLRGFVATLKKHWGNKDAGLQDVFDNKEAAAYLLDKMHNPGDSPPRIINDMWDITRAWARHAPSVMGGVPTDIGDNFTALGAIQQALIDAGVSSGNTGSAPKTQAPATLGGRHRQ